MTVDLETALTIALGITVSMFVLVSILLIKSLRGARAGAHARSAMVTGPDVRTSQEANVDITRITPFSPGLLPRIAMDDGSEEEIVSESKALLQFEGDAWIDIDEPTGPTDLIVTSATGTTDKGITRRRNEDAYLVDHSLGLYVVADGMGGYGGGDIAATTAVNEIRAYIGQGSVADGHEEYPRRGRELIAAIERANALVHARAETSVELKGMGTTVIAARFSLRKQRAYIAHVGDSRCYRFRAGSMRVLTEDHTLASKGVGGPMGTNIRRAVGVMAEVKVDLIVDVPMPGDVYLLCSDGLSKMVSDETIQKLLGREDSNLKNTASALVTAANAAGGRDNVTVVLIRVTEITASRPSGNRTMLQSRPA